MLAAPRWSGPGRAQQEARRPQTRPAHDPAATSAPATRAPAASAIPPTTARSSSTTTSPRCCPTRRRRRRAADPLVRRRAERAAPAACMCFSPRHDLTLAGLPLPAIRAVVDTWARADGRARRARHRLRAGVREQGRDDGLLATRTRTARSGPPSYVPDEAAREDAHAARLLRRARARPAARLRRARSCARGERVVVRQRALARRWCRSGRSGRSRRCCCRASHVQRLPELDGDERAALADVAAAADRPLRQPVPELVPLLDGLARRAVDGGDAPALAPARALLPAAAALGHGAQVHGRLRDAGRAAARPDPRDGRRAAARAAGRALPRERRVSAWTRRSPRPCAALRARLRRRARGDRRARRAA